MKNIIQTLRDWIYIAVGWLFFYVTRKTPSFSFHALIRLFCRSGGTSNDRMSKWIALCNKGVIDFDGQSGVLGIVNESKLATYAEALRVDGCLLFPSVLSKDICDRLTSFALENPAIVRPMDGQSASVSRIARFDPLNPTAVRYDLPTQQLLDNTDVQGLLADSSLLAIAQRYFNCPPRVDVLSMWWHSSFQASPDSEAAQLYHFDMDRIRWLKVFIYLTDVGPDDGPHTFVLGSHRTRGIPTKMLSKGYARLDDDDVLQCFGKEKCVELCAPRGSLIVEDTRGLHKGNVVKPGGKSRLMLQLQFSNALFGAAVPAARLATIRHPELVKRVQTDRHIYDQFLQ